MLVLPPGRSSDMPSRSQALLPVGSVSVRDLIVSGLSHQAFGLSRNALADFYDLSLISVLHKAIKQLAYKLNVFSAVYAAHTYRRYAIDACI
ncbi:hypothetical protein [Methylobacterium iners]|uniref:HTH luxR-type domain-containing protein n=1 Tax=Methylobacterium iners TaxID=418707 RepID=A0ABQ4RVB8_9HYPH|nr:hypothetical protein [Methylobacterium iners]GJD94147.1 hypothetical protein OCOJLMKI_1349 [Methylobacterium iners]